MRFIKRLALNKKDPASNRFAVELDGRIVTTSKTSLQIPVGATVNRPATPQDGQVRFNTSKYDTELFNLESYNDNGNNWDTPWETVKTNRQGTITPQDLGVGNGVNSLFGPLSYNVSTDKPQNIMVFIENVYQIPATNYTLVNGAGTTTSTQAGNDIQPGDIQITVSTTTNILIGMVVEGPVGALAANTTILDISTITNVITINQQVINFIPQGSDLTFYESAGTYINFSSEVPYNKPVFVLLGLDGYAPPL